MDQTAKKLGQARRITYYVCTNMLICIITIVVLDGVENSKCVTISSCNVLLQGRILKTGLKFGVVLIRILNWGILGSDVTLDLIE